MKDVLLQWAHAQQVRPGMFIAGLIAGGFILYVLWLRFARRVHSRETLFEMRSPFPLVGRPDLIMQEWGGLLVIHDLKTRKTARLYASDQLQLSLYALLLRRSTGRKVAPYGYIRLFVDGSLALSKVDLNRNDKALEDLYASFVSKADAPGSARLTAPAYLCRNCGFKGRQCIGKA